MALIKTKPTSPGRRFVLKADRSHLHKGSPVASLTTNQKRTGARNNLGRITTRHKGGGHRHRYRDVDFVRAKDGIPGKVERLEYDPNRSAHLALVLYADGERRYILAPKVPTHIAEGESVFGFFERTLAAITEVGEGVIQWEDVLPKSMQAGVKNFFVEHDTPHSPFESIQTCYEYLRNLRF